MMRLLAIETATSVHSVALLDEDRVIAEQSYETKGRRGGLLLPAVDEMLRKARVTAKELDAVAVSVGPGSFTGLRVGLATAKGLALGAGAKLVGVSTLEVLAAGYPAPETATICALLDAYRGEVYMALFRKTGAGLERLSDDTVLPPEKTAEAAGGMHAVHLIGDGAARYRDRLAEAFGARASLSEAGLRAVPTAAVVGRLGRKKLTGDLQAEAISPVYLRRAEAEVNYDEGRLKSPLARVTR